MKIRIKLREETVDLTMEEATKLSAILYQLLEPKYRAEMQISGYFSVRLIGDDG